MQFDPVRLAHIQMYLTTHKDWAMSGVFQALVVQDYSLSEIRQAFNLWITDQYS